MRFAAHDLSWGVVGMLLHVSGLRLVIFVYGVLDIANGVEGYLGDSKMPWLVWNAGFGTLAIIGALFSGAKPKFGYSLSGCVASLDTVFFGLKLLRGASVWPAGVITCAAAAALACSGIGLFHSMKRT